MPSLSRERLGGLLWLSSLQYFVAEVLVASRWTSPYRARDFAISDLGNTACGEHAGRYVCSPWHGLMNGSFLLLGATTIAGALLMRRTSPVGLGLVALAGLGHLGIGMFPENVARLPHLVAAGLVFGGGNLGMFLAGAKWATARTSQGWIALAFGTVGLVAFGLFAAGIYLDLGYGGMERLAAYPLTVWMAVYGAYRLLSR